MQLESNCYWVTVKKDWEGEKYQTQFNKYKKKQLSDSPKLNQLKEYFLNIKKVQKVNVEEIKTLLEEAQSESQPIKKELKHKSC